MDPRIEEACDITFAMWKQVVPKGRKRKKVLKNGPRVYILSPDPEEQPSKGQPSKSNQRLHKRRRSKSTEKH